MLDYKDSIHNYVFTHKAEIIDTLKEIIKIPSVRANSENGAPFGKACAEALEYIETLYCNNGLETKMDKESGYLLACYGKGEKTLGLFAHADVVPVGNDWIFTSPFEPIEKEGYLIGRGVLDDKAAVVIALYCAKMLKELNIPFNSRLLCYTGTNEESGMQDIKAYVEKNKVPDFSLVNDSAFPLYRGNKAMLKLFADSQVPLDTIIGIEGSNVRGSVLGKVVFKLKYSDELYDYLKANVNERMSVNITQNEIEVSAEGISYHTALPEGSLNAASIIAGVLEECQYISENDRRQMTFLKKVQHYYYGEPIGINSEDEFGKLTIVNDIIELRDSKIHLHFNLRFGCSVDIEWLKSQITSEFSKDKFNVEIESESPSHIVDENHPLIETCLNVYKEFTGDKDVEPRINAGGTYARYIPSAIEIGTTLIWGAPSDGKPGHGGAHQPDECINIEGLLKAIELTMLMLIECDKRISN